MRHYTGTYLFFLFLLTACASFSQSVNTRVSSTMHQLLQEQQLSGLVGCLVDQDSIQLFSAGVKNLRTGEKLHEGQRMQVGSITKTVLALGILKMVTEKKLELDEPVKKYLPDLPLDPWESKQPVTIRHLLDHTAGLSDLRFWHFFSSSSNPTTPLRLFYEKNRAVVKVFAQPGTVFSYSNMGYTLLGMVIEAITQQPYETYLDKHLLAPLSLTNSTFGFVQQEGAGGGSSHLPSAGRTVYHHGR